MIDMSLSLIECAEQNEEEKDHILQKYNHSEKQRHSLVHKDISTQSMSLQKRLAQRKFKKSINKFQGTGSKSGKFEQQSSDLREVESGVQIPFEMAQESAGNEEFSKTEEIGEVPGLDELDIQVRISPTKLK